MDLEGKVTIGENNRRLQTAIKQIVKEGNTEVILNLANVRAIDSSGLGEIVAGYSTMKAAGGELVIIGMPSRVKELMTITKLYTVFDVYDQEWEAITAFQTAEAARAQLPVVRPFRAATGT
jgi:anti-sigma B factor antagonist